ncbi:hypothetical protein OC834_005114 [Tilletia horrida]|nr:hypothetical protein OC834_005114 [Tilletia horrida]
MKLKAALGLSGIALLAISPCDARMEKHHTKEQVAKRAGLLDSMLSSLLGGSLSDLSDRLASATKVVQEKAQGSNSLITPVTSLFQKTNHLGAAPETSQDAVENQAPADAIEPSGHPPPGATSNDEFTNLSASLTKAPPLSFTGPYSAAIAKAQVAVKQLTLEEKVKMVTGTGWTQHPCVGGIDPNPKINFGGLCLQDNGQGVRFADRVTTFPAGITTAATFSKKLIHNRAVALAQEFKAKGVNVLLGPGMNMLRAPASGRAFEYAGADPYLAGEVAFQTVQGIQSQGVQSTAKHFLFNDQEHFRNFYSANVDARTTREIYAHPFLRAIQAGVASVMCSYNMVNSTWACQNDALINGLLKTEMGFQGWTVSDWGAQHSGVLTAQTIDMAQPGDELCCFSGQDESKRFWGSNLVKAVTNGTILQTRVDDMVTRVLAGWYMLGQDDPNYPEPNFDSFSKVSAINQHVEATADHDVVARSVAAAGIVLAKNQNHALPIPKNLARLAIIGSDAAPAMEGPNFFSDRAGVDGVVMQGWGSGSVDSSYVISPYEAIQARARKQRTAFNWMFDNWNLASAASVATPADMAVVFVGATSGEEYLTFDGNKGDRNNLTSWRNGDELVKAVAAVQKNTVVVVSGPAQVDVEAWVDHVNVTAVLFAHMGGSEAGNAIADVLFGDVNPSGRLPYTLAKKRSDYSADVVYTAKQTYPPLPYSEGLMVDYRWFESQGIEPRYAFGHGLSYTSFTYGQASGKWVGDEDFNAKWGNATAASGLPAWLFADTYQITFTLTNSGSVDGFEVPQVYLGFPKSSGEPPKVLRAFDRFELAAGASTSVTFMLSAYDLCTYDPVSARWLKPGGGAMTVYVGASIKDVRQTFVM